MGKNLIEDIFDSRNDLDRAYTNVPSVKNFDMHRKHFLYGKIDKTGDAIHIADTTQIKQTYGGDNTHFALNFVQDAFRGLRAGVKKAVFNRIISRGGPYAKNLKAYKSLKTNLDYQYNQYLNQLYTTFVDNYLTVDRRHSKIKNYKDFVEHFMRFIARIAHLYPLTRTGYILSHHCPPYVSGLILEIAPEIHGIESNLNAYKYLNDPNFVFFLKEASKHGFMVDKNAPWRIVFNVASGIFYQGDDGMKAGGQMYMDKYAVSYENVFQNYYAKSHLTELVNIKKKMYSLYESYYIQFNTYETLKYVSDPMGVCNSVKIINERNDREIPGVVQDAIEGRNEYWLKIVLKLRMLETRFEHTPKEFVRYEKEMIDTLRLYNTKAALNYINNLTRGHEVTNFNRKGEFWYGVSERENRRRRAEAKNKAYDPDQLQYPLVGTKNMF